MGCTVIVVVLLFLFVGLMLASMFSGKYTAFEDATKWFVFFVLPLLFALKFAIREDKSENEKRRQEAERELERQQQELAELERKRWEQTEEGQVIVEQRRREAEENERVETERRKKKSEEQARLEEQQAERTARNIWRIWHESKTLSEIAKMSGLEFEAFLYRLLTQMGFTNLQLTPINDQGGDLVGDSPEGVRTVVQAKRWKNTLGNSVVQELLGAILHYDAVVGMVITNSAFTPAARQLAAKDQRITLCDGSWLESQIRKFLSADIPEFDWAIYNAKMAPHQSPTHRRKPARRRKRKSPEQQRRVQETLARVVSGEITPEEAGRILNEGTTELDGLS